MSNTISLSPAMCRRGILSDRLQKDVDDLLADAFEYDLVSITLSFMSDNDTLTALAAMSFVMDREAGYSHCRATETGLPAELDGRARDLALRLMETQDIASEIDEADPYYLACPPSWTYNLSLFRGCAILYPDDPVGRLLSIEDEIRNNPDHIRNRAQICTLILNDASSHHQRAAEPRKVLRAFERWKEITGTNMLKSHQITGLELSAPSQIDILTCTLDHIEKS